MTIVREYGRWVRQASTPDETTSERKRHYLELIEFVIDELKNSKSLFSFGNKNTMVDAHLIRCNSIRNMIEDLVVKFLYLIILLII